MHTCFQLPHIVHMLHTLLALVPPWHLSGGLFSALEGESNSYTSLSLPFLDGVCLKLLRCLPRFELTTRGTARWLLRPASLEGAHILDANAGAQANPLESGKEDIAFFPVADDDRFAVFLLVAEVKA